MRSPRRFCLLDATRLTRVVLCLLFVSAAGPALASTSGPFTFENADIQTVVITLEAFTVKVVPLNYARAHEMAYTLSWVAPPSVQIVPYYPTNSLSLIISGHPAAVEGLVGIIK